jgi:hypothetical protein
MKLYLLFPDGNRLSFDPFLRLNANCTTGWLNLELQTQLDRVSQSAVGVETESSRAGIAFPG